MGGAGIILGTGDGGHSWQLQGSGTKDHFLEVHALSGENAFVAGAFGTLLSTNDGGVSWRRHKLSWESLIPRIIREIGYVEPHINTVYFANAKMGWLGGEFGLILHTRDGGRTWSVQRGGSKLPQIVAIRFRDSLNGWAVGRQGTLLETTDGGRIWREIDAATKQDLYGIWVDGQHGLIVGQRVVSKTNNGGSDWVPVASTANTLWLSGIAGNGDMAIAVGQAGTIRKISLSEPSQNPSPREATAP